MYMTHARRGGTLARTVRFSARFMLCVAVLLAGTLIAPQASAAQSDGPSVRGLTRTAVKGGAVVGGVSAVALERPVIKLVLPHGQTLTARREHLDRQPHLDAVTWYGTVQGGCAGTLVISNAGGVASGHLSWCGVRYDIEETAAGIGFIRLDGEPEIEELPPRRPAVPLLPRANPKPTAAAEVAADVPLAVIQDLLVVTTQEARARYGAGLDSMILNAVASANAAYRSGDVGIYLNVVSIKETNLPDVADSSASLDALVKDLAVAATRNQTGADIVILITSNGNYGLANLMGTIAPYFERFAYGVVPATMLSMHTLAHEVGHIQSLMHDRETTFGDIPTFKGATPYGFGYRVCRTDNTGVRDIMSYACPAGSGSAWRYNLFSDPTKTVSGYTFGVSYETDPNNAADAVRALRDSAATVAAFRAPVAVVPAKPTELKFAEYVAGRVTLEWQDNAGNEDGFAIERSPDGNAWTEIARVAADTTRFPDPTVTTGSALSWRVSAFNSAGYSAPSPVVTLDDVPDAFSFPSRTNVALSTTLTAGSSAPLTGFNVPLPITVTNGEYSINCGVAYTAAPGQVTSGQSICLRHTSAATYATSTVTTVTVGGTSATYTSTTLPGDSIPDSFFFPPATAVEPSTIVTSAALTITGFNVPLTVTVSGGQHSVNCTGTFTSDAGTLRSGQTICVRHTSAASYSTQVVTTLVVGGVAGVFISTTRAAPPIGGTDDVPDAFSFAPRTDVAPSSLVGSGSIALTGFNVALPVTVTNGEYSIGCNGVFTSATGQVTNGQSVCLRHTSAATFATSTVTTLTVGRTSATFRSTTASAGDSTPDSFSFAPASGVEPSTPITSAAVTITGFSTPIPVTVSGGQYSINCTGTFTADTGTLSGGQTICVRHTSAPAYSAQAVTTLVAGGVSGVFTSTTRAAPAIGPGTGTNGPGGSSSGSGGGGRFDWVGALLLLAGAGRRLRIHRVG